MPPRIHQPRIKQAPVRGIPTKPPSVIQTPSQPVQTTTVPEAPKPQLPETFEKTDSKGRIVHELVHTGSNYEERKYGYYTTSSGKLMRRPLYRKQWTLDGKPMVRINYVYNQGLKSKPRKTVHDYRLGGDPGEFQTVRYSKKQLEAKRQEKQEKLQKLIDKQSHLQALQNLQTYQDTARNIDALQNYITIQNAQYGTLYSNAQKQQYLRLQNELTNARKSLSNWGDYRISHPVRTYSIPNLSRNQKALENAQKTLERTRQAAQYLGAPGKGLWKATKPAVIGTGQLLTRAQPETMPLMSRPDTKIRPLSKEEKDALIMWGTYPAWWFKYTRPLMAAYSGYSTLQHSKFLSESSYAPDIQKKMELTPGLIATAQGIPGKRAPYPKELEPWLNKLKGNELKTLKNQIKATEIAAKALDRAQNHVYVHKVNNIHPKEVNSVLWILHKYKPEVFGSSAVQRLKGSRGDIDTAWKSETSRKAAIDELYNTLLQHKTGNKYRRTPNGVDKYDPNKRDFDHFVEFKPTKRLDAFSMRERPAVTKEGIPALKLREQMWRNLVGAYERGSKLGIKPTDLRNKDYSRWQQIINQEMQRKVTQTYDKSLTKDWSLRQDALMRRSFETAELGVSNIQVPKWYQALPKIRGKKAVYNEPYYFGRLKYPKPFPYFQPQYPASTYYPESPKATYTTPYPGGETTYPQVSYPPPKYPPPRINYPRYPPYKPPMSPPTTTTTTYPPPGGPPQYPPLLPPVEEPPYTPPPKRGRPLTPKEEKRLRLPDDPIQEAYYAQLYNWQGRPTTTSNYYNTEKEAWAEGAVITDQRPEHQYNIKKTQVPKKLIKRWTQPIPNIGRKFYQKNKNYVEKKKFRNDKESNWMKLMTPA